MARLFIFAIGGTGSRVLKSLTMLLASGVKPNAKRNFEIVPIIIDPHKSNEDLKRTVSLLANYQSIVSQIGFDNGFFSTPITTLENLVGSENSISGSFTFELQQVSNTRFKEYIDLNQLDEPNRALAEILFSGKSINKHHEEVDLIDVEMDIGFVGNPNIGSVVLNQFKDSEEFKEFASNFNEEDRVFIISSIFGGTGAAGFPTILKNIRNAMNNPILNGVGFLQDSKIGALTVLPYFNIKIDDNSPIQKSDFIAKTKAALHYYKENVTGNNSVNAMYYIGDDHNGQPYENDPGDGGQKNKAHFVELASALAILDFLSIPDSELTTSNGKAINPIYKEFFIKKDSDEIKFSDLDDYTERFLSLRLSQFAIFIKYINEHISKAVEKEAWSNDSPQINKTFLNNSFYRSYLQDFLKSYEDWLNELQDNKRSFKPFNLKAPPDSIIKDINGKTRTIFKSSFDFKDFDNVLSRISHRSTTLQRSSAEQRFINLFYESTEKILKTYFGLNN